MQIYMVRLCAYINENDGMSMSTGTTVETFALLIFAPFLYEYKSHITTKALCIRFIYIIVCPG